MTNPLISLWPCPTAHSTRTEGIRLGLIVGTVTWLWVALVDAATGNPWRTFTVLGGIVVFTLSHYVLNMVYGMVLLSAIHGAERTPSLILGALFCGLIFEGAFMMFSNILIQNALSSTGWLALIGGNVIGTAVVITLLARTHPLREYLRRAEEET